jgi:hypothetical protein
MKKIGAGVVAEIGRKLFAELIEAFCLAPPQLLDGIGR